MNDGISHVEVFYVDTKNGWCAMADYEGGAQGYGICQFHRSDAIAEAKRCYPGTRIDVYSKNGHLLFETW